VENSPLRCCQDAFALPGGDVFGGTLCDCHAILDRSLEMIAQSGAGALIYLHSTSRGFNVDDAARLVSIASSPDRPRRTSEKNQRESA